MQSVTVLQLGDVHFPQHENVVAVDHKDHAASPSLVSAVAGNPLQQVVRRARRRLDELGPATLLAQCGDMTSFGDLASYDRCVEYLTGALDLPAHPADLLHAVPGNHDVDRSLCDPADTFAKFEPLADSWQRRALPILSARGVRVTRPVLAGRELLTIGANSCVGSGEHRYLPEDIRDSLAPMLDARFTGAGNDPALLEVSEQLDTLAFYEPHLATIHETLESVPTTRVALVVGHHPLLPQTVPRIEIYTEILNAGVARSRFSQVGYPVIYLHGHVHADPVEVLAVGSGQRGRLIMISAPLLADGFNEIRLDLSASGWAIGCVLTQWRRELDGVVRHAEPLRIQLRATRREWVSELAVEYARAAEFGQRYRFEDFRRLTNDQAGVQRTRAVVADGLLEAEWAGYLLVTDRDHDNSGRWVVERVEP
jgi:hypothetical protein